MRAGAHTAIYSYHKTNCMKSYFKLFAIALTLLSLASCSVVGDIFKAGMNFGIFIVVGIIVLIVFLILKARKKNP